MKFAKALAIVLLIPVLGLAVAQWVLGKYDAPLKGRYTMLELCSSPQAEGDLRLTDACEQVQHIDWMRTASVVTAIAGLMLLSLYVVTARWAGTDRRRMTRVFRPLVAGSLLLLVALVVVQGGILMYAFYLTELMLFEQWHLLLVVAVGIGVLPGVFSLLRACVQLMGNAEQSILGVSLTRDRHPQVFAFAGELAGVLGAREPDHIVVGLDPNFFVTSADIRLKGSEQSLRGETLYLSLPLMRIFSRDEIKAVVGHELGHFRGDDTQYSLKFAPVYAGLTHAVKALANSPDITAIAQLPARSVLEYMIDVFKRNLSVVNRTREFAADRAACEVAPPQALATSLLKVSLYASAWGSLQNTVAQRMTEGRCTRNMSSLFASIVKYDVNEKSIPAALGQVAERTISHPTDSHPPTALRLAQFDIDIADVNPSQLLVRRDNGVEIIDDHLAIEETLTDWQQQMYIAMGVEVPDEPVQDGGRTLIAAFGAHMVIADGQVFQEEIDYAEVIGRKMIKTFDHFEFREFCHYPESLPSLNTLFDAGRELSAEAKAGILDYLSAIASSDGETSVEERRMLEAVARWEAPAPR